MNYLINDFLNNVEKLCGKRIDKKVVTKANSKLHNQKFLTDPDVEFGYRQLNEVLLLCNKKIVTKEFFHFLANIDNLDGQKTTITFGDFADRVNQFRILSMLQFGSFRFSYNYLCHKRNIKDEFGRWVKKPEVLEKKYKNRKEAILNIEPIEEEKLLHLGYLTGDENDPEVEKSRVIGEQNFETYLTYDYIDVYVATSMREKWDYIDINRFCQEVFAYLSYYLNNIRYFDPTLNFHKNSILKGLIEGLMLKRAKCTLYLAQESDTMGKDSEMASTLAQGKPVIVYLPKIDEQDEIDKLTNDTAAGVLLEKAMLLMTYMTPYMRREFEKLLFNALPTKPDNFDELKKLFQQDKQKYRREKKYQNLVKKMVRFKTNLYDKRAETLRKYHPLRFQVDLQTGVANGILVAREIKECSKLIYQILTNRLEFDIYEPGKKAPAEKDKDEYNYRLIERSTGCAFRVVTEDEKITNSFWNLYKLNGDF